MAEHTPTPWHLGATEHTELVMGFKDDSECVLAELDTDDVEMDESEANAAFIVKAVNNHEPMLKALQAASEYLESDASDGFRPAHRLRAEIDTAIRNAVVGSVKGP